MNKIAPALLLLVLLIACASAVPASAQTRCDNCKMKVADDSKYKVVITLRDGDKVTLCSIFCGSMESETRGDKVAAMSTVDYNTGGEIDARTAVWVEGGDAKKMMSSEARIAFKDKDSADAYTKEHGGKVVTFEQAYKDSVSEWKDK